MGRNCPGKGLGNGASPQFGKGAPQVGDKGEGKGRVCRHLCLRGFQGREPQQVKELQQGRVRPPSL
eukprot:9925862-Karenia_brevis.AAC.1